MSSKITRERLRHKTAVGQTVTPGQGIDMNEAQQNIDDLARRVAALEGPVAVEEFDPSGILDELRRLKALLFKPKTVISPLDGFRIYTAISFEDLPSVNSPALGFVTEGIDENTYFIREGDSDVGTWNIMGEFSIHEATTKNLLPDVVAPAIGYATSTGRGYFKTSDGWMGITHIEEP